MGIYNHIWSTAKKNVMAVLLGVTISDRCVTFVSVTGESMYPTFTAANSVLQGDFVLAERRCLEKYKFSHGDVVLFKCPSNHKELFVKRLIALPGEWIQLPGSPKVTKIPEGHCWVEGDNAARSWDSRAFGPVRELFVSWLDFFRTSIVRGSILNTLVDLKSMEAVANRPALIPIGLIQGRVTHIIWPPSKIGQVERKMPEGRISPV